MAKKNMEEINVAQIDLSDELPLKEVPAAAPVVEEQPMRRAPRQLINCLRNERIIVRHIPKLSGMITNPKHILYGGMADDAVKTFVVPKLTTGTYVNVLTNNEMAFLEQYLGMDKGKREKVKGKYEKTSCNI